MSQNCLKDLWLICSMDGATFVIYFRLVLGSVSPFSTPSKLSHHEQVWAFKVHFFWMKLNQDPCSSHAANAVGSVHGARPEVIWSSLKCSSCRYQLSTSCSCLKIFSCSAALPGKADLACLSICIPAWTLLWARLPEIPVLWLQHQKPCKTCLLLWVLGRLKWVYNSLHLNKANWGPKRG